VSRGFKHNQPAETIAQHYLDSRSYLSEKNGRVHEILFGLDKSGQREKVYHQAKGKCQKCGRPAPLHDPRGEGYEGAWDHIKNHAGDRCDCLHNAQWLCGRFIADCHTSEHPHPQLKSIPTGENE
jgi:hypothetical protein